MSWAGMVLPGLVHPGWRALYLDKLTAACLPSCVVGHTQYTASDREKRGGEVGRTTCIASYPGTRLAAEFIQALRYLLPQFVLDVQAYNTQHYW